MHYFSALTYHQRGDNVVTAEVLREIGLGICLLPILFMTMARTVTDILLATTVIGAIVAIFSEPLFEFFSQLFQLIQ